MSTYLQNIFYLYFMYPEPIPAKLVDVAKIDSYAIHHLELILNGINCQPQVVTRPHLSTSILGPPYSYLPPAHSPYKKACSCSLKLYLYYLNFKSKIIWLTFFTLRNLGTHLNMHSHYTTTDTLRNNWHSHKNVKTQDEVFNVVFPLRVNSLKVRRSVWRCCFSIKSRPIYQWNTI